MTSIYNTGALANRVQRAEPGGEAELTEADAAKLATMPLDARARISALPAELRASAIRMYASDERDRALRTAAMRREQREAAERRRNRVEICRRALAGEYTSAVKRDALRVLRERKIDTNSCDVTTFEPTIVQAIIDVVNEARKK